MLRIFFLLLLTSCTLGSSKYGGKRVYQYDPQQTYDSSDLSKISRDVVTSYQRDPRQLTWKEAFPSKNPIRSTSTLSFETIIQPTRSGISGSDKVYLSPKGKQLLTEKLLSVWEEAYTTVVNNEMNYFPMRKLFDDFKFHSQYGTGVKSYGGSFQEGLAKDDIFVMERGKRLSALALFQPHFSRDLSLLLVPGYQLFGGPRGNDYQKYYVAEAIEKFELDALYVIMVEIDWQATREDKITKKSIHQKAVIKFKITPILSYKIIEERLKDLDRNIPSNLPNLNWASYEASVDVPIDLDAITKESSFEEIDSLLLRPIFKSYADMCVMVAQRLYRDFNRMKIE
ncbi:MAG: hypothetical protein WDA09_03645 [Bacteriovoracaceae bacterium]